MKSQPIPTTSSNNGSLPGAILVAILNRCGGNENIFKPHILEQDFRTPTESLSQLILPKLVAKERRSPR